MSRPVRDGEKPDVSGHSLWLHGGTAAKVPTLVRLSSSHPGVPEGEAVALAAEVATVGQAPTATGEVTFRIDGEPVGTAVLDEAGQAVLTGVQLSVGVHAVVASYAGDAQHAGAISAALPQAVTAAAIAVVVLVASPARTPEGLVVDAELVDPRTGRLAEDATGELHFSAGKATLGAVPLRAGRARLVLRRLPRGRLRVSFPGDREHAPAEGRLPDGTATDLYPADPCPDPYPAAP